MKFGFKGALGIAISIACLYLAFRNVHWSTAMTTARNANYWLLLLSAVVATLMFPLRARRWRTILDPVAPALPFGELFRATAIGMMVNNVVPLRAGEFARAYALSREEPKVSFATSLASLVVDRVFDAIVVLLLLALSMLTPDFPAGATVMGHSMSQLVKAFAVAPFAMLVILYALVFFPDRLIRLFELTARRLSPSVEKRGSEMLRRFADGLSVLRTPGHFLAVFGWTLLHWLVQPIAFWLGLRSVGIDVPWSATLFMQGLIVVGVALPAAPGFFGMFELMAAAALGLYGVSQSDAATWALLFHVASLIPITLIGAYYFARMGLTMSAIGSAATSTPQ
jgi:uncharacterized protein (TIRG00374 family)